MASSLDIYATYESIYVDNLPVYVKVKLHKENYNSDAIITAGVRSLTRKPFHSNVYCKLSLQKYSLS